MLDLFTRKNFPEKIKIKIIKKTARCQICNLQTDCGECAHIVASGKNGPRNKQNLVQTHMIPENYDTNNEANGLYLCANCHTLIDTHPDKYTYENLIKLKQLSQETQARADTTVNTNDNDSQALSCVYCNKTFSSKYTLKQHIDKQVCLKTNRVCPKCGIRLATRYGLIYHINHHVCEKNIKKVKLVLKDNYDKYTKSELIIRVARLEDKVETLTTNSPTVDNSIIVFPKEFGKEDMKYIQEKLGDIVGPLIKYHTFNSIPWLFRQIHDNQKIPEYHNVYVKKERSLYAIISDGKMFKHQSKKTVIDQIIKSKRSILDDYINEKGDQLEESVLNDHKKYLDRIDNDNEFRKNMEVEIGGMLLDMKYVIINDEKTGKLLDNVDKE